MTWLYIALIIIGLLLFAGSFFVSEKLSASDIEEISKVSEKEIKLILEKELKNADSDIKDSIEEHLVDAYEEIDVKTDKETTEKIMQISDFSDTVLESINKSHEEIKFMYSMLDDKQKKLSELEKEVGNMQSASKLLEKELDDRIDIIKNDLNQDVSVSNVKEFKTGIEVAAKHIDEDDANIITALEEKISEDNIKEESIIKSEDNSFADNKSDRANINQEIINLYNEGLNEIDIAKKLGKGIGEVKLVLGLFK